MRLLGLALFLSLAFFGCRLPDDQFRIQGTVLSDEGCWRVVATDGTSYEPTNLSAPYQVNGLKVSATLTPSTAGSFCMAGKMVDIVEIEKR
ncbi:MAG TPA: hypothetical protein VLV16_12555 [Gemmatimonadales bacterium]|nr:hypothetical protein [Gemmatimonadales bacterium]